MGAEFVDIRVVILRNHKGVTFARWEDIEESYVIAILIDLLRRNLTGNNLAENTITHESMLISRCVDEQ